jgi:hypothetical protein
MADLVRKADFIFVMTYGHLDSMLLLFPSAAEKTFLLREFETDLPVMEREFPIRSASRAKSIASAATRSAPRCPGCSISSCARPTTKRA